MKTGRGKGRKRDDRPRIMLDSHSGSIYGLSPDGITEFKDRIQAIIDKTPPLGQLGSVEAFRRMIKKS